MDNFVPIAFKESFTVKDLIHLQKRIYPDLLEVMRTRYTVLYTIYLFEPIGRRGIVEHTKLPGKIYPK